MRLERVAVDHVHWTVKQTGDVFLEAHVLVDRPFLPGLEFDKNIDIAVRPLIAARDRTEHGRASDAARPQCGLGFLQSGYDIVAAHNLTVSKIPTRFQFIAIRDYGLFGRANSDFSRAT